ncbi:MAG TPA: 1-deoxy-D-xylulose-5-phosphate reductoisomerase, partial [Magnetospirillaceae bacterium]|nr:1-deoxy-D-xylulose-5-phosphate reductoisomerase [Magnetospirillaceae bacterium]
MRPRRLILLGATGSIGQSALEVAAARPDLIEVAGLSAHTGESFLLEAGRRFPGAALCLSGGKPASAAVGFHGAGAIRRMLTEVDTDIVLNGISGASGLGPSLDAVDMGLTLALANKETMVLAGRLVLEKARKSGVRVIPVDSEHAAVFQLVERFGAADLEEIVLTASGGAFRDRPISDLAFATPEEASRHPTWRMGRKITIDSASMANKGLEVIEAVRFFGVHPDHVKVLVHPQSRVHALIRMRDGALYAQVSGADMRSAIQAALTWPRTESCGFGRLDLAGLTLAFLEPDPERFPL